MTQFNSLVNSHEGQSCFIYGLGPTANQLPPDSNNIIIGVNNFESLYGTIPNYLVVIDSYKRFEPNRARAIENTNATTVFTQFEEELFPFKTANRCLINLDNRRGDHKLSTKKLDISYSSPYVALQIAYHLGFHNITLCGVDISLTGSHHLCTRYHKMKQHFDEMKTLMIDKRPWLQIKSLSNPGGVLKDF